MRIGIYTSGGKYLSKEELTELIELCNKENILYSFNYEYSDYANRNFGYILPAYHNAKNIPADTDFMLSYGGDGTFLHCIAMLESRQIPIIGINSGRLGFLASVRKNGLEQAIKCLLEHNYTLEKRSMLRVRGDFKEPLISSDAFNEFTLQKNGLNMINVELHINGEYVANYMADGLIISTPSGSTAYSMSVGGPIISPSCDCFIINPIAPHNLTMRPLIVNSTSQLSLSVTTRNKNCIATLDNRAYTVDNKARFTIGLSSNNISMVKLPDSYFFDTLRQKLMWGTDITNSK